MEKGYIRDFRNLFATQETWGNESMFGGGLRKVFSFACTKCGYLESYLKPKS